MKPFRIFGALALAALATSGGATLHPRTAQAQTAALGDSITGEYDSQFAGGQVSLRLEHLRGFVVGYYTSNASMPGSIAGQLRGNLLVGRWTDASSTGGFALVFAPDGHSFVGTWGRSVGSRTNGGPWIGRVKPRR